MNGTVLVSSRPLGLFSFNLSFVDHAYAQIEHPVTRTGFLSADLTRRRIVHHINTHIHIYLLFVTAKSVHLKSNTVNAPHTRYSFESVEVLITSLDGDYHDYKYGFSGRLLLECPTSAATVSWAKFGGFHFREMTGHLVDVPAWKHFGDLSHNRSPLELAQEYRMVDLPSRTRLLCAPDDTELNREGRAIGWVILDRDMDFSGPVLCAHIVLRILHGQKSIAKHVT
ncbi:hypothetical protein BDV96DRAFT_600315 [Lophiotrema nucula]|uniref:Uncharacterized protein n=1 Tax=Lophiotrema nucula TaxID=690887 RepID=A0A6A5Z4I7_9PLEO|nr:hypothetical protein BDV96DRAFT_600315 [Lophiotrema nucula]